MRHSGTRSAAPRRSAPSCPPSGGPILAPPIDFLDATREAFLRLGAATVAGALVGVNRELRGKPAGMRTHALVSLGAAIATLSSDYLASSGLAFDSNAITRAVQGIIAGVGFLGGGVILKTSDRGGVRHLTTAASIWVVACIGIVCGVGQWPLAVAGLSLTLLMLVIGGPVEGRIRTFVLRRVFRSTTPASLRPGTGETRAIRETPLRNDLEDDD